MFLATFCFTVSGSEPNFVLPYVVRAVNSFYRKWQSSISFHLKARLHWRFLLRFLLRFQMACENYRHGIACSLHPRKIALEMAAKDRR